MEVVILSEDKRKDWDEYIMKNEYSIAWQSYDWYSVIKKHYDVIFYPLAVIDQSKICGILPLYFIKTGKGGGSLISVPHAVAGGIVADDDTGKKLLLEHAAGLSKKHNNCGITLKQYKIRIDGDLRTDENFYNKELDLTAPIENIWEELNKNNRKNIEKADKEYTPVLEYPSKDLDPFYKLLLGHLHRRGIPCVSKKWIKDLLDFDMYKIAFLKHNNKIVAATLVKEYKKTVSFPFSCSPDMSEQSLMFTYSLYWNLIKYFKAEGMEIFHSGRIPNTDKADAYRLGWGGTKYKYYYQYYPSTTSGTEYTKKRGKKREILEKGWKLMPRFMARIIGPYIVKKFP